MARNCLDRTQSMQRYDPRATSYDIYGQTLSGFPERPKSGFRGGICLSGSGTRNKPAHEAVRVVLRPVSTVSVCVRSVGSIVNRRGTRVPSHRLTLQKDDSMEGDMSALFKIISARFQSPNLTDSVYRRRWDVEECLLNSVPRGKLQLLDCPTVVSNSKHGLV